MIQIVHQKEKSNINIVDIYDIVDLYCNSFDNDNINGHDNCVCKKHFNKSSQDTSVKNKKINDMKLYLFKHFEKINDIKNIMGTFHQKYPKINWLMNQSVYYEGNDNFIISKVVGDGAFGKVYMIIDKKDNKQYVIKVNIFKFSKINNI